MCVDYRKLNDITEKDAYPLPYIEEILYSVGNDVKFLSTLDLFSGFHQIPMKKEDRDKTCFTTIYGNYNFKVIPFGLCNAPATFQREMNRIFLPLIGKCMFVYIDDLVIFSCSLEEHLNNLQDIFNIIKENGLKVNLSKCHFLKKEVQVLGHLLTTESIKTVQKKVDSIKIMKSPTNLTQLRSFLGAVGYYRKFIKNYSSIAQPLYKLQKKNTKFQWTQTEENAFSELKENLVKAPILSFPNFDKQFIIRTDASYDGLGDVLIQKDNEGVEHPIFYVSRTLKKYELNYSVTDIEGTAAFYCTKKFKSYLNSNNFKTILFTDHKPLVGLFNNNKEPNNARQMRWVVTLSMLNVIVKYEPGKKNVVADALSRLPLNKEENQKILITNSINTNNNEINLSKSIKEFLKRKIVTIDDVKYYKENNKLRKVIDDKEEKIELLLSAHNVGHEGFHKTYNRLKKNYYWENMSKDVEILVKTCHQCQLNRPQPANIGTENHATTPESPFRRVGLDIIGPLPETKSKNKYIIVLVDYFTKWVEAEPLITIESNDVIKFLTRVFSRHGIPEVLITDNGPQFTSDTTKGFLDLYGVYVHYTSTYHPESNGQVENRNREIGKYLRLLGNNQKDWDEILPSALWALRTCKSEVTKFSSFELLYGRTDLQPFELSLDINDRHIHETTEEYLIRKFTTHWRWILEATNNINNANKLWENRRRQKDSMKSTFEKGDLVLIRNFSRKKLDPYYIGPMKIVKMEFNTAILCDPLTGEIADRNVHKKNLIHYYTWHNEASRDEVHS